MGYGCTDSIHQNGATMNTLIDFSYVELGPYIRVYKNLLPDNALLTNILNNMVELDSDDYLYSKWEDWFIFGKYCHEKENINAFITGVAQKFDETLHGELRLHADINNATKMAMAHYVGDYKIPLPQKSRLTNVSLAFYNDGVDISKSDANIAMNFHSDYVIREHSWPGEKFLITVTTYINDNYDGGEIVFMYDNTELTYKPRAGDIIVFPSGNPVWPSGSPYFHSVKTPLNGRKYLLRSFLKYVDDSISQEWVDGVNRYGEEEYKRMCVENKENESTLNDGMASPSTAKIFNLPSQQIVTSNTIKKIWVHPE